VIAATAGARQAALMHHIWEKNVGSPDEGKRRFAAGAASSLSFWALGTLPVHRSGSVYKETSKRPSQVVGPQPQLDDATLVGLEVHELTRQDKIPVLTNVILPVPVSQDTEFEELLAADKSMSQVGGHGLFTELLNMCTPIRTGRESAGTMSMATDDVVHGGATNDNQAQLQKTKEVEMHPDISTPVLLIHATSDTESEGDETRRATSAITVSSVTGTKVTAAAMVKSCVEVPKTTQSARETTSGTGYRKCGSVHGAQKIQSLDRFHYIANTIMLFDSHHCHHHSNWNLCLRHALQQSSIRAVHLSLFNSG